MAQTYNSSNVKIRQAENLSITDEEKTSNSLMPTDFVVIEKLEWLSS
jgi:hypothetical protein